MNALYTTAPGIVGGQAVRTDWRVMAEFENALFRVQKGGESAFIRNSFSAFYPRPPLGFSKKAWDGLLWFYRCGKEPRKAAASGDGAGAGRPYDFEADAALIFAAFRQAYSIDLARTRMHWWQFRALFDGLPENCQFCRVVSYRTMDTGGLPEASRQFYEKMRARYALPAEIGGAGLYVGPLTQEDAEAAFIARLRRH